MSDSIGSSGKRSQEYLKKFSRKKVIRELVHEEKPVIFDVGAHKGESIQYFLNLYPNAKIHAFEPDPASYAELSKKYAKSSEIVLNNLALSSSVGQKTFYQNTISHTNSLFRVNSESQDSISLQEAKRNENIDGYYKGFNHSIEVGTSTLDQYCLQNELKNIDLLKLDTQGSEDEILSSGIEILQRTNVILTEICFFDYYEKSLSFYEVEKIIHPLGFRLYDISEISKNPMNGRTDWVDAIYLNQSTL